MGGCGALYDGVSPDGTTYDQPSIQQIHQAYGRQFQLPQEAAHNEICAQIGMLLFSWRMFQVTGDSKYIDNIENELYNGILSGISLNGKDYFYTEALRRTAEFPYTMRWPKQRQHYISCFCCPPNTTRTLCQAQEYAYSLSDDTLYVNLYGENVLKTKDLEVEQSTNYPWDGKVKLTFKKVKKLSSVKFHIPEWCRQYSIQVNGGTATSSPIISRTFKKGDVIEISFEMRPRLIEANPLVEEAKNQVAVKRGPVVYCLEGQDIEGGYRISDLAIPSDIQWNEVPMTIEGHQFVALEGDALLLNQEKWNNQTLYREVTRYPSKKVKVRLIPYYAWDNRGNQDMSLWLNLIRK